ASTQSVTTSAGALGALTPNTTYSCFANACNAISCSTYTLVGTTVTLAAVPAFTGSDPQAAQLTARWSPNGNPAGTLYTVLLSTGASPSRTGFTANASWATYNLSALSAGLTANSTYSADLKATSRNALDSAWTSLPSTMTLANPPVASAALPVGTAS